MSHLNNLANSGHEFPQPPIWLLRPQRAKANPVVEICIEPESGKAENSYRREGEMNNKIIASVLTAFCVVGCVWAGVVPGKWDKLIARSPGTEIIVTLTSGEQVEGTYQELGGESLLMTVAGAPRNIPKSGIAKITTAGQQDSIWNGALIGAAAGGIAAAVAVGTYSKNEGGNNNLWIAVPLCAGAGLAAGIGVDSAFQGRETLYEAPR